MLFYWTISCFLLKSYFQAKSHLFTVGDGQPQDVEHFAEAYSQFDEQVLYVLLKLTVLIKFWGNIFLIFYWNFSDLSNFEEKQGHQKGGC